MATAQAASNEAHDILKREARGAPVHSFNPDASPAQKAAITGKDSDRLAGPDLVQKPSVEKALPTQGAPTAQPVPTITIEKDHGDGDKFIAKGTEQESDIEEIGTEASRAPGALPSGAVPAIPEWYVVGWREMANLDKPKLAQGEEKDKTILDQFLGEQFYGAWYHNAAIVIVAVFTAHFMTRFGFGWGWLFLLLAVCNTYYSTSMTRFRRNARDDIQRELVKTRLGSEHESAEWLNHFMERFWLIYEPVLSATIVASVDQILSANTPAFLDSLRLTEFTLGTKAPRIDKVRTFPRTEDDVVMMDWGISFTPTDETDLTKRQADAKVNPKICLSVRVGKGLATAALPILVEDITFTGLLRVRMKLVSNFPHIQVVDICFLEKPFFDFVLKPIGGDTFGFDIANIPGLSSFIRDTTHSVLGPMMYDPNVFTLNLEQLLSGKPLDSAIGVLQVTVHSARGIKGVKIGGGTPDPYVSLSINNRNVLARTKTISNTYNPTWVETKYILVQSLHERLSLDLFDYNDHRADNKLGETSFDLSLLESDATQEGITSTLLKDGKERGELRYDVSFYPVLEAGPDKEEIPDSSVGIVRLVVHQAKDLDNSKSMSGELNPLVKVYVGKKEVFRTPKFKHTNNPIWEASHEFLCSDKENEVVSFRVIDDRDLLKDPVVGQMSIRVADLLSAKAEGRDWFPLSHCKTGRVRISSEWKPVSIPGSLQGAGQYTPPIGVVRLWIEKAVDVKNVEAALGGKSDPYVRVQVRNVTKGRTEVINNNLNPVWDEIVYIPVHSLRESLMLECMDYQHLTKDRSLGSVELHVSDLAKESPDNVQFPYESTGVKEAADPIRLDKRNTHKGTLFYHAKFIPATKLKSVKFDRQNATLAAANDGSDVSDRTSIISVDEQATLVEPTSKATKRRPDPIQTSSGNGVPSAGPSPTTPASIGFDVSTPTTDGGHDLPPTPTSMVDQRRQKDEAGLDLSTDELLQHQSGIIVFDVISGRLEKKGRLEVLLDDGYWPCFSTEKARSKHMQWDYVGEGFIKELDFGQVWLRLNEAPEGEKDDIVAEWKGEAKEFLHATLEGSKPYQLLDQEGRIMCTVTLESRYIPVPVKLEPRESINNQGTCRIHLIDGHEIRGVDRGGKSDPYVVFILNGTKVYKSQTKKKTLTPDWDELFEVTVPSRVAADFKIEVFDWNQIEQAKSLGIGTIDLTNLEPFQSSEQVIPLTSTKHGEKGYIRVNLVFTPMIIAKTRKNTSTFTSAGRAMTQIGGLPVNAGKGVFHGVTGVFKKGDKRGSALPMGEPPVPELPPGQASKPVGAPMEQLDAGHNVAPAVLTSENGQTMSSFEPGILKVTVLDAKDLTHPDIKPYVVLRCGDKEQKTKHTHKTSTPEWHETFKFSASAQTQKIFAWVFDHKTLGKDKEVAGGEVDIWRHIKPEVGSGADVYLELRQGGMLRIRLEFAAAAQSVASSGASITSRDDGLSRTISHLSPSRFSLHRKRATDES